MSNCFMISDGHAVCHQCKRDIPDGEQYTWYDLGRWGENHCQACVDERKQRTSFV